jgi:cell division protein FtsN
LAEVAATVKDKLKGTVRDVIAPEPATKEPDREPTDWKRMLVDRDYRRQKQEERERRQQQEPERQQGREDAGGRSRDRS